MTAVDLDVTADVEQDARLCALSTDGTGEHCDCWFNPRNGGGMGADPCCFCEGEPICWQIEENAYEESAHREEWLYDLPDGEVERV